MKLEKHGNTFFGYDCVETFYCGSCTSDAQAHQNIGTFCCVRQVTYLK